MLASDPQSNDLNDKNNIREYTDRVFTAILVPTHIFSSHGI